MRRYTGWVVTLGKKRKTALGAKAYDVAAELLEVQALRESRRGHQFRLDEHAYMGFASQFPFEETPDQGSGD